MTTITSRGPALIAYLINLFKTSGTLGAATPPVVVFDGPAVNDRDAPLKLYVGLSDPGDPNSGPGYESDQDWASLGRRARTEIVTIPCCAEAWTGDDIAAARTSCAAITAAVETLMQADTTQFGGNVLFPMPGLTNLSSPEISPSIGSVVRQSFDLIFKCRIGG